MRDGCVGKSVVIVNDRALYNRRYRAHLVGELEKVGFKVESIGLFDGVLSFFRAVFHSFSSRKILVVSNLRSNILALLFFGGPCSIILNGLGRYRKNKRFRVLFVLLMKLNGKKVFIVQSYSDYRFFRRYCSSSDLVWIPGSGGSQKAIGLENHLVLVQRDEKIALVKDSVKDLIKKIECPMPIAIVGCVDQDRLAEVFEGIDFSCSGYVDAKNIFLSGSIFVQPSGYGEGFPHTLADAICSGMKIFIAHSEFIRYGIYKMPVSPEPLVDKWYAIKPTEALIDLIRKESVTDKYIKCILRN